MSTRSGAASQTNKFARRREATRADLLRLGIERLPIKGYSNTTIDDLVRDSGYSRGAFYFHFAGKEEFFLAVLRARAELRDEWWLVVRRPEVVDTRTAVITALRHLNEQENSDATWFLLIADFFQAVRDQPEHAGPLHELYQQWMIEIGSLVRELQARSFARTDLAPERLAGEIFATAQGHAVHRTLYQMPADDVVDALVRIICP